MAELDPFSMVHNALWDMIDQSATLSGYTLGAAVFPGLIKPGNKIKYNSDTNRDPFKDSVQTADTPELILSTAGTTAVNLNNTSCSTLVVRQYQWLLSTGDFRMNYSLYPVQFALVAAMLRWQEVLTALKWRENTFVRVCRLNTLTEGQSIPALNRNLAGWSSLWNASVDMYFKTDDLLTLNLPPG